MTDRERQQAEALAVRRADCPKCHAATWWPAAGNDGAILEATCDCGRTLRLERCGCIRAREPEVTIEEAQRDPEDLATL